MGSLDWDDPRIKEWMITARDQQNEQCMLLDDIEYETYDMSTMDLLRIKVGYALFGVSEEINENYCDLTKYKYSDGKTKQILKIINVIKGIAAFKIQVAFIFLNCRTPEEEMLYPVIRVLDSQTYTAKFIDAVCRVYKDWPDFLENNKLPKCFYCFPKNGIYKSRYYGSIRNSLICFKKSPACKKSHKVLSGIDTLSSSVAAGSAAVVAASLLAAPITAPVLAGATVAGMGTGIWAMGRTINTLIDRGAHNQTLSLKDSEAKACWIDLAAGISGTVAGGVMQASSKAIKATGTAGKVARAAVLTTSITNITISGVCIGNNIHHIIEKESCNKRYALNLLVAIFFFTNSVYNVSTIVKVMNENNRAIIFSNLLTFKGKSSNVNKSKTLRSPVEILRAVKLVHQKCIDMVRDMKKIRDESTQLWQEYMKPMGQTKLCDGGEIVSSRGILESLPGTSRDYNNLGIYNHLQRNELELNDAMHNGSEMVSSQEKLECLTETKTECNELDLDNIEAVAVDGGMDSVLERIIRIVNYNISPRDQKLLFGNRKFDLIDEDVAGDILELSLRTLNTYFSFHELVRFAIGIAVKMEENNRLLQGNQIICESLLAVFATVLASESKMEFLAQLI